MEEKLRALGVVDEPSVVSPTPGVNTPLVRRHVPFVTLVLIRYSLISQALLLTLSIPSRRQLQPVRQLQIPMQQLSHPLRRSQSQRLALLGLPSYLRHSMARLVIWVSIFPGSQCHTPLVLPLRKVMMAGIHITPSLLLSMGARLPRWGHPMYGVRRSECVAQMGRQCTAIRNRCPTLVLLV